jgi:membrane glycosyltransferase
MQIAVCIHMFIYGMKMRLKTIGSEKIDKHLIYLNLFNMSRLLFPNFYDQKPRFLMIILVKELALKLVQIILKLVLATQTLSNECGGNIGILVLLIVGNLFSLLQMIFFMTDRLTSTTYRKHEEGFRNLSDLD